MNMKHIIVAAGIMIAVVLAIVLFRGGLVPDPLDEPVTRDLDLSGANVLLITLDTTRADRVGVYGYAPAETPHLDSLASDGVLFEQAVTPTAFTLPSHSSILTGLYPPFHGVRLNGGAALAEVHTTLAERLGGAGYRCGAVIGAFVIDQRWGLSQGFDFYEDDFQMAPEQKLDLAGVQRSADRVVDLGIEWLGQGDGRPFFAWFHFYDPHIPYAPPEPYASRFAGRGIGGLYDGEIAFTDSQIGRLLDWLEEQGLSDDTLVVVVGDHGEALGDHGESEHGYYIYDATVRIPLMIKAPGADLENIRVSQQVRTIDVLPTVLDLVGVDAPGPVQGESLVPLMVDPESGGPRTAYSESMSIHLQYGWSALYGLRTAEHKYIEAPRPELYSLGEDPSERRNRVREESELAARLQVELAALRAEIEAGAPDAEEADLDDETLSMLAALGYVGGASVAPSGENLADPKDRIHLFEAVGYASQMMMQESYGEGIDVLEKVLEEDPEIPQAKHMLATCYRQAGRTEEAKVLLDEYLRDHPDSTPALITMAGILSEEGRIQEVVALAKRVLAVDDRNAQAYALMAGAYMDADDHAEALPLLEKAVEIQPKLTRNRLNLAVAQIGIGRIAEAEEVLDEILVEKPKFPLAHFHLGLLYEQQKRYADARAAYVQELELFPNSVVSRFNLGNLSYNLGDAAGAEREMRTLIGEAPDVPRPYFLLARILLKQERDPAEVESLAKAGLDRTDADDLKVLGYYLLADVYSRQGRQQELERVLERAQFHRSRLDGSGG